MMKSVQELRKDKRDAYNERVCLSCCVAVIKPIINTIGAFVGLNM